MTAYRAVLASLSVVICIHGANGLAKEPETQQSAASVPDMLDVIAVAAARATDASLEPEQPGSDARVEEVVVTAQKREERLQDVPISIQAFSGENLASQGIATTRQLERAVPGLRFTSVASFPLVFIRGLGSDNFVPSADPSIATYIDGIYVANGAATLQSLANVERVEVLKGPQGTLFGRNATGGAISVVTREPGEEFSATFDSAVGNFNSHAIKASASGPIASGFSASLAGESARKESYYSNPNYEVPRDELDALRLKFLFRPNDTLSLGLGGYRSEQAGLFYTIYKNTEPSLLGTAAGMQPQQDNYRGETDFPSGAESTQTLAFGTLSWALPGVDLRLLGSDQRHEGSGQIDFDGSPVPAAALSTQNVFTDLQTAEFQLLSNEGSWASARLTWVAGLYYLRSSAGFDPAAVRSAPGFVGGILAMSQDPAVTQFGNNLQALFNGFGLQESPFGDGGLSLVARGVLDTRSSSAYVQGTYQFTDWIELTLGGRVQQEKRFLTKAQTELSDFSGRGSTTLLPFELQSARSSNFAPKAVLGLRPTENAMVYLSYSVAYKSGTYNVVNTYLPPNYIVPEKVSSFEIGTKLELLEGLLRVDAAVFDSDIQNLQSGFASLLSGGIVQFFTVPRARSRGAEINIGWLPMPDWNPGLSLGFNAAYIDAIYKKFPGGPGFDEDNGLYSGNFDHSGNRITNTPRVSGNIGLVQTIEVSSGSCEIAIDDSYNSSSYATAQNLVEQEGYALLNARLGYLHAPWNLRLTLFGHNLLDRRYHLLRGAVDFGKINTLGPPREYGLRLGWTF